MQLENIPYLSLVTVLNQSFVVEGTVSMVTGALMNSAFQGLYFEPGKLNTFQTLTINKENAVYYSSLYHGGYNVQPINQNVAKEYLDLSESETDFEKDYKENLEFVCNVEEITAITLDEEGEPSELKFKFGETIQKDLLIWSFGPQGILELLEQGKIKAPEVIHAEIKEDATEPDLGELEPNENIDMNNNTNNQPTKPINSDQNMFEAITNNNNNQVLPPVISQSIAVSGFENSQQTVLEDVPLKDLVKNSKNKKKGKRK